MSYAVEWIWGVVVFVITLLLVFVPWFAAIAVVVAAIAVLVVALAALVGLLALAAAALASPYLLVRSVRRRLGPRTTRRIHSPTAIRSRSVAKSLAGLGRAHLTALASDQPDEAAAILRDAARRAA
jgi:membrane protein implicated in regulation of membrane protease activity